MTQQERAKRPVGRPAQPGRRAEILDAAVKVVAERGLDTLTLGQLAQALGFSTYTLTYHFGSKDQLLAAVVEHVETTLRAELAALAGEPGQSLPDLLRRYLAALGEPEARSYLRLWLELTVLAGRHPDRFPGFYERAVDGWRALAAGVLRERTGSEALATLLVATVTGLEIEYLLNPDRSRLDQAVDLLIDLLSALESSRIDLKRG
ncbi:TetR family transcriptional regulator [Nonomuraea sp. NN258]|uniref:TetR/AcrR family transcriptional regulator n=1 Tax=Nonomuraea antri TaxID=2730852 RepID=UPI001568F466|nr:TetR family transcriptional regulator [Nonomuraea antri]NRQ33746.1 TetR family transcriptional regulator [Nonomuraea antri]